MTDMTEETSPQAEETIPQFSDFDLDDSLLEAVAEAGFETPTEVQWRVIPQALGGTDIFAQAPTGSGKTAAFALPVLNFLLENTDRKTQHPSVLVLVPTRELAAQVSDVFSQLARHTPLQIATITGGQDYLLQKQLLRHRQDVIIATPGRLDEICRNDDIVLDEIRMIVLDEADRMLDMGFRDIVFGILNRIPECQQALLFSATLDSEAVFAFADEVLDDPLEVRLGEQRKPNINIKAWAHLADSYDHKLALLKHILAQPEITQAIVFVKTRERAQQLFEKLQFETKVAYLHGNMDQAKRDDILKRLRGGDIRTLVTTDVAARGVDITTISHVINFDLPRQADIYVHRVGRTARGEASGIAIALVEAHDFPLLKRIERYTHTKHELRKIEGLEPKHKKPSLPQKKKKKKKKEDEKKAKKTAKKPIKKKTAGKRSKP